MPDSDSFISTSATTKHATNLLLDMSHTAPDTPRPFQSAITQRDTKTEVAKCVGGVACPILANIYLQKLDVCVETVLIPEYTRGEHRAHNPAYQKVVKALAQARKRGDRALVRELSKRLHSLPSGDPNDPGYRRLRYARYTDDGPARSDARKTKLASPDTGGGRGPFFRWAPGQS
jgi:hypothetical protein